MSSGFMSPTDLTCPLSKQPEACVKNFTQKQTLPQARLCYLFVLNRGPSLRYRYICCGRLAAPACVEAVLLNGGLAAN